MAEENKKLDWNPTSADYAKYRPGYPESFFELLRLFGVGAKGQDVLDLGSGTGALAIPFARAGSRVTAVDLAENQIAQAKKVAASENLDIRFAVCPAENTGLAGDSFDAVTASMCFRYFDSAKITGEVLRLLRKDGLLMISSIIWSRKADGIAAATEKLIADFTGGVHRSDSLDACEVVPSWAAGKFRLKTFHLCDVGVPFTRESWRGRIRASRWIGAALPDERVKMFDVEHARLLEKIAPEKFEIKHTIKIQIFDRKNELHP